MRVGKSKQSRNIAVFLSMTAVLIMTGSMFGMLYLANRMVSQIEKNIVVNAYFSRSTDEGNVQKTFAEAKILDNFYKFELITPSESAKLFPEIGENMEEIFGTNPLPYTMRLFVSPAVSKETIESETLPILKALPYLYEVDFVDGEANQIKENRNRITWFLLLFTALFLGIALLLINNTIRLQIYSDRFKVKSMQLVGASEQFIQKPYLILAAKVTALAALLASIVVFVLFNLVVGELRAIMNMNITFQFSDIQIYSLLFVTLLISGLIIALSSSLVASRKYLRSKIDELY